MGGIQPVRLIIWGSDRRPHTPPRCGPQVHRKQLDTWDSVVCRSLHHSITSKPNHLHRTHLLTPV